MLQPRALASQEVSSKELLPVATSSQWLLELLRKLPFWQTNFYKVVPGFSRQCGLEM